MLLLALNRPAPGNTGLIKKFDSHWEGMYYTFSMIKGVYLSLIHDVEKEILPFFPTSTFKGLNDSKISSL